MTMVLGVKENVVSVPESHQRLSVGNGVPLSVTTVNKYCVVKFNVYVPDDPGTVYTKTGSPS
jgi:hypothetical protein